MVNWSELPDLAAVALLAGAFASVARRSQAQFSKVWLIGWLLIALHFAAFVFLTVPGMWGTLATLIGLCALVWAGLLFMWASVPYRQEISSRWMLAVLLGGQHSLRRLLMSSARWGLGAGSCRSSIWRPPAGDRAGHVAHGQPPVALDRSLALIASLHLSSPRSAPARQWQRPGNQRRTVHRLFRLLRFTFGAPIAAPLPAHSSPSQDFWPGLRCLWWGRDWTYSCPQVHIESEVWNLPKYVVAVGMILLLLEDQIEHNRHLALHDH